MLILSEDKENAIENFYERIKDSTESKDFYTK